MTGLRDRSMMTSLPAMITGVAALGLMLVALWRYGAHGVIPQGVLIKAA
mgnify:CR=1 FL=1